MIYNYEGSQPELATLYQLMNALDSTKKKLQRLVARVRSTKGVLNEPKFSGRLTGVVVDQGYKITGRGAGFQNYLGHAAFMALQSQVELVIQQEQRRVDYFRSRVIMSDWLIPRLEELQTDVLTSAKSVRDILEHSQESATDAERLLGHEALVALNDAQACLGSASLANTLAAARELVDEPDATGGEGRRALEMFVASLLKGNFPYLAASEIPAELQLEGGAKALRDGKATQGSVAFVAQLDAAIPRLESGFPGMKAFLEKYPLNPQTVQHHVPVEAKEALRPLFDRAFVHFEWIRALSRQLESFIKADQGPLGGESLQTASPLLLSLIAGLGSTQASLVTWWNEVRQIPIEMYGPTGPFWQFLAHDACKRFDGLVLSATNEDRAA